MSTDISLHELLDLSIGTPDVGSVNFSALHTLLHAILGHLKIERVTTTWKEADNDHDSPTQTKVLLLDKSSPYRVMEEKLRRMEEQMRALEALPSASELMSSDAPLSDMWTLMQLRGKAQANEDGVSKVSDTSAGSMRLTKSTVVFLKVPFKRTTAPCLLWYAIIYITSSFLDIHHGDTVFYGHIEWKHVFGHIAFTNKGVLTMMPLQ